MGSMTAKGDAPEDITALEEDFPAWVFGVRWVTANSGSEARTLFAFPLDGGAVLTDLRADGLRRKIREAGG